MFAYRAPSAPILYQQVGQPYAQMGGQMGAAYDRMGQIDAGECGVLFRFPYPGDVDRFKQRINTYFENADAAVRACTALPIGDRQAWTRFILTWRAFLKRETGLLGAYDEWLLTCGYSREMDQWLKTISSYCVVPGPKAPVAPNTESLVRWIIAGTAIVAGTALLLTYAPEIKAVLPSRGK